MGMAPQCWRCHQEVRWGGAHAAPAVAICGWAAGWGQHCSTRAPAPLCRTVLHFELAKCALICTIKIQMQHRAHLLPCRSILHRCRVQPPCKRRQMLAPQALWPHAAAAMRHAGCPLVALNFGAEVCRNGRGAM